MNTAEYTTDQDAYCMDCAKVLKEAKELSYLVDDVVKNETRDTTKRLFDNIRGLALDAERLMNQIGDFEKRGVKRPSVVEFMKS